MVAPNMATLDQIKEVVRGETDKINLKLDKLTANVEELCKTVKFLNDKYDELLPQVQQTNGKLNQQAKSIDAVKVELDKVKKCATDAMSQIEEIVQYVCRDCLEISGIKPSAECTCEKIVTSISAVIDVTTVKEEISIAHQIPTYKEDAPPKIIVEFTRRNRLYHNGSLRKLANEKIQDLPYLNAKSTENLYISESLTPYKKQFNSSVK